MKTFIWIGLAIGGVGTLLGIVQAMDEIANTRNWGAFSVPAAIILGASLIALTIDHHK